MKEVRLVGRRRKSVEEENGNIRMSKEISETAIELSGKEKKARR